MGLGRRRRWCGGLFAIPCPHETSALIIDHRVCVEKFFLQCFQRVIVQVELGFERSIGRPSSLLEEVNHLVEYGVKIHYRLFSNAFSKAFASLKSAVSKPSVNQL